MKKQQIISRIMGLPITGDHYDPQDGEIRLTFADTLEIRLLSGEFTVFEESGEDWFHFVKPQVAKGFVAFNRLMCEFHDLYNENSGRSSVESVLASLRALDAQHD